VEVQEDKGKRPHPPWFAYVLAIKTFGAGPMTDEFEYLEERAVSGFFTAAGRTEGMQACAIIICMALWLRQKEAEVPRRERA
jgi:hypothetical protein